jgi:hypothetical protein
MRTFSVASSNLSCAESGQISVAACPSGTSLTGGGFANVSGDWTYIRSDVSAISAYSATGKTLAPEMSAPGASNDWWVFAGGAAAAGTVCFAAYAICAN